MQKKVDLMYILSACNGPIVPPLDYSYGFLNIAQTEGKKLTFPVRKSTERVPCYDLLTYLPHPNQFCSRVPLKSSVVTASWL